MKIAQVIATFPPYHGGMGYVCYHNALQLAARGHEVTVFTLDHGRMPYDSDPSSFRIVRLKTPLLYGDGGVVPHLYSRLKGFDAVHLHYPFFGGAEYVYLVSLLCGNKYFLTYHMDVPGNTLLKKALIKPYTKLLLKRIIRKAALVGAVTFEHLRSSDAAGFVDWERVVEMPNGVDTERFRPRDKNRALLEKLGVSGKFIVLFVGNLQPFKGLDILIEAMARTRDNSIVLVVVGGGYREAEYRKQVADSGLEKKVVFAGPQSPDGDLPDYYNLCDLLVLPSTYSESFGLVVLEAMASGKPIIVSTLPGPAALVTEGKDGFIVNIGAADDLKEKIEHLARNDNLCREMGAAAREKAVGKYSWGSVGSRLESVLEQLVKSDPLFSSK